MQMLHEPLRKLYQTWQTRPYQPTLTAVSEYLSQHKPNLILLSAYLTHYPAVKAIGELAAEQGIPVLLGGPASRFTKLYEHRPTRFKGLSVVQWDYQ